MPFPDHADDERPEATAEELKALANPLRLRILRLCLHDARTNKELAERLGKDPATVLHHVRLLVQTGFLAAQPVRTGNRGALEKPYLATGKSWTLRVNRPEDQELQLEAMVEAVRDELVEAGAESWMTGARLGLKLSPKRAKALQRRIDAMIRDAADADDDPDGDEFGLFVVLHRRS